MGVAPSSGFQDVPSYVHDVPDLVYQEQLGRGKVFKALQCLHDEGFVVVKLYVKRGDIDTRVYEEVLARIQHAFSLEPNKQPSVITLVKLDETDKAVYIARQFFTHNLYDRFHAHPFLTDIERRWLSYQLIRAVAQCHAQGVCHGDVKTENCMVTSWNWLFLTDIAFFKPTHLPANDPSDYNFFFGSEARRRCYIAPERFFGSDDKRSRDSKLTGAMDVFSLGCCIAEIFLGGDALFDHSELLEYRDGTFLPARRLEKITDAGVREMVTHMIQRDANGRYAAAEYLKKYSSAAAATTADDEDDDDDDVVVKNAGVDDGGLKVFPSYFRFLYKFLAQLLSPELADPELKIQAIKHHANTLIKEIIRPRQLQTQEQQEQPPPPPPPPPPPSSSTESGKPVVANTTDLGDDVDAFIASIKEQHVLSRSQAPSSHPLVKDHVHSSNTTTTSVDVSKLQPDERERGHGLTMIVDMVCGCIQNVRFVYTKLTALELLLKFAPYVEDEVRLNRIVPYCIHFCADESAMVRSAALRVVAQILRLVRSINLSDAQIFPEYIFPALSRFPSDPEELARLSYAQCIGDLCETSRRFLDMSHYLKQSSLQSSTSPPGTGNSGSGGAAGGGSGGDGQASTPFQGSYDNELEALQDMVANIIINMISDGGDKVKRAVLVDMPQLCVFIGRERVNNMLLPHLITVLNSPDWQLRSAFLEHIVGVTVYIGRATFLNYILPCIEQALCDVELVIQRAIEAITALCQYGLFDRDDSEKLTKKVVPLLCHPSTWIRNRVIDFFVVLAKTVGETDTFCFIIPHLTPVLQPQLLPLLSLSRDVLAVALKEPLSRDEFNREIRARLGLHDGGSGGGGGGMRDSMLERDPLLAGPMKEYLNKLASSTQIKAYAKAQIRSGRGGHERSATGLTSPPQSPATRGQNDPGNITTSSNASSAPSAATTTGSSGSGGDGRRSGDAYRYLHTMAPTNTIMIEETVVEGKSGVILQKVQQDLFDSLGVHVTPYELRRDDVVRAGAGTGTVTPLKSDGLYDYSRHPSRKHRPQPPLVSGQQSQQQQSPPLHERVTSNTAQVVATASGDQTLQVGAMSPASRGEMKTTDDNNRATANNQPSSNHNNKTIPRHIRRALKLPGDMPSLGQYELAETMSYSSFYRNHPRMYGRSGRKWPMKQPHTDPKDWRPQGILVTSLTEHTKAVNSVAVSRDNTFLASGSDDGTVRIWDCRALKGGNGALSDSQLCYTMAGGGAINQICVLDTSHSVAAVTDDGRLHVFRVEFHAGKTGNQYIALSDVKKFDGSQLEEGRNSIVCVDHANTITESLLVYGTLHGGVYGWDLRAATTAFNLRMDGSLGVITCMTFGPSVYSLLVGTARGFVVLWDLRFHIPVHIFQHSSHGAITHLQALDHKSILPPPKDGDNSSSVARMSGKVPGKGPIVLVATELENNIAAFDLYTGECRVVIKPAASSSNVRAVIRQISGGRKMERRKATGVSVDYNRKGGNVMSSIPLFKTYMKSAHVPFDKNVTVELKESITSTLVIPPPYVTSSLCCLESFLLTSSTDRAVTYWDLQEPTNSYRVSSDDVGTGVLQYSGRLDGSVLSLEENLSDLTTAGGGDKFAMRIQRRLIHGKGTVQPNIAHKDSILDMKAMEFPQKMLVTAGRDGVVKVWV